MPCTLSQIYFKSVGQTSLQKVFSRPGFECPPLQPLITMSPPVSLNNYSHVHKISVSSPFYVSDDSLPILEDNSIFLAMDQILSDFDADIFQQENSSVSKSGFDETLPKNNVSSVSHGASANPCSVQEESILLTKENTSNFEFNSFLEKENSSLILEALESLCPILEEGRLLSSNFEDLDPNIFLEQESSPFEPCNYGELQGQSLNNCNEGNLSNCFEASDNSLQLLDQQETSAVASPNIDKRLLEHQQVIGKRKERKHKLKRVQIDQVKVVQLNEVDGQINQEKVVQLNEEDGPISKRQEHNEKEKARRMMLNTSYLALGALLPADSRRKKKRRSAPVIMDRVLQYIPELEIEIEKLTLRKKKLHSKTENEQNPCQTPQLELEAPTVSVHEVVKGEVIVQITLILKDHDTNFSKLLENLEEEGRSIMSASTLQVCKERVCYNMHIQMNGSSLADDYVAVLREKIVSLLS